MHIRLWVERHRDTTVEKPGSPGYIRCSCDTALAMSPARNPPPPAASRRLPPSTAPRSRSTACPNCGAPAGKRCPAKRSRPPAKITHLARGWLDRPCRRCGAQPGERCRTPSGRDADPHTPRRFSPNIPDYASRRPAGGRTPAPADAPVEHGELATISDPPPAAAASAALLAAPDAQIPAAQPGGPVVRGELVGAADELVTDFSATLVASPADAAHLRAGVPALHALAGPARRPRRPHSRERQPLPRLACRRGTLERDRQEGPRRAQQLLALAGRARARRGRAGP